MINTIHYFDLYCGWGGSNKDYVVELNETDAGYEVRTMYGPSGKSKNSGPRHEFGPGELDKARKKLLSIIKSKVNDRKRYEINHHTGDMSFEELVEYCANIKSKTQLAKEAREAAKVKKATLGSWDDTEGDGWFVAG